MIPLRLSLVAAAVSMVACAPLQQAPLVYSSKVTVGVDVSANVAENQGASVNIGVKTIDSAYVPVAVSKEIDKKSNAGEKTIELRLIEARYGYGEGADSNDPSGAKERDTKINAYFTARQLADTAAREAAQKEEEASKLGAEIVQIGGMKARMEAAQQALDAIPPTVPAPAVDPMAPLAKDVDSFNQQARERNRPMVSALVGDANRKYNVAQVAGDLKVLSDALVRERDDILAKQLPPLKLRAQETAAAAAKAKEEALKVAGLSNTNKSDAMSVYGSFDSKATGETAKNANAGLLIGKVFSTGLASQNLTEAVKIGANVQCFTSGFEALQQTTVPDERKKILDTLVAMCSPQKTMAGK